MALWAQKVCEAFERAPGTKGADSILAVYGRGTFLDDFNCVINQLLTTCLEPKGEKTGNYQFLIFTNY